MVDNLKKIALPVFWLLVGALGYRYMGFVKVDFLGNSLNMLLWLLSLYMPAAFIYALANTPAERLIELFKEVGTDKLSITRLLSFGAGSTAFFIAIYSTMEVWTEVANWTISILLIYTFGQKFVDKALDIAKLYVEKRKQ